MRIFLIFSLFISGGCSTKYYDTCPSISGNSCPIDGSPCTFCGMVKYSKKFNAYNDTAKLAYPVYKAYDLKFQMSKKWV